MFIAGEGRFSYVEEIGEPACWGAEVQEHVNPPTQIISYTYIDKYSKNVINLPALHF